jgi:hypothetical protein
MIQCGDVLIREVTCWMIIVRMEDHEFVKSATTSKQGITKITSIGLRAG